MAAVVLHEEEAARALSTFDVAEVCLEADDHGVGPLVLEALPTGIAPALRTALTSRAVAHSAADMLREADLRSVLGALGAARVPCVLMKGAALAYTHYARPDLRPRLDTDILIAPHDRDRADEVLRRTGFVAQPQLTADLVMYQVAYARTFAGDARHLIDLHWRIANPQTFGGVLTFSELFANATPIPALGPYARGLDPVHAIVLACVHRVAHHKDAPNLIWIYDIHLLASRLCEQEWRAFADLAHERGVGAICGRSLDLAMELFLTEVPEFIRRDERLGGAASLRSPTAAHLDRRRHVATVLDDLRNLPAWSQRFRLIRQHLLPPAEYMREIYAPASRAPLAVLYALRAFRGARRWLARAS